MRSARSTRSSRSLEISSIDILQKERAPYAPMRITAHPGQLWQMKTQTPYKWLYDMCYSPILRSKMIYNRMDSSSRSSRIHLGVIHLGLVFIMPFRKLLPVNVSMLFPIKQPGMAIPNPLITPLLARVCGYHLTSVAAFRYFYTLL